jgi:3-oxoacyl-[acyl-carrier protein] reductase
MDLELRGKVALVTGASRGIGRGIAEGLAAEGVKLVLTGRDEAMLAETKSMVETLGSTATTVAVDLRRPDAAAMLVEAVRKTHRKLDILVNNAGTTKRGDFFTLSDEDWQEGFALKFFAHVRLARAAWPLLVESKGSLVIIGGTAGKQPTYNSIIGGPVNAAVNAFAQALAQHGNETGVQVNVVSPGHVDTDRLQKRIDLLKEQSGLPQDPGREPAGIAPGRGGARRLRRLAAWALAPWLGGRSPWRADQSDLSGRRVVDRSISLLHHCRTIRI